MKLSTNRAGRSDITPNRPIGMNKKTAVCRQSGRPLQEEVSPFSYASEGSYLAPNTPLSKKK